MKQAIQTQIERMAARGATYADARWYPFEDQSLLFMWNGNLKEFNASREHWPWLDCSRFVPPLPPRRPSPQGELF